MDGIEVINGFIVSSTADTLALKHTTAARDKKNFFIVNYNCFGYIF